MPVQSALRFPGPLQTVILDVEKMKCGGCSASVKRILMAKPEVHSAAVNLLTECAVVQFSERDEDALMQDLTETLTSKVGFPCPLQWSSSVFQAAVLSR